MYLLYRTAKTVLGRSPAPTDLHEMAMTVYPAFREIMRADELKLKGASPLVRYR